MFPSFQSTCRNPAALYFPKVKPYKGIKQFETLGNLSPTLQCPIVPVSISPTALPPWQFARTIYNCYSMVWHWKESKAAHLPKRWGAHSHTKALPIHVLTGIRQLHLQLDRQHQQAVTTACLQCSQSWEKNKSNWGEEKGLKSPIKNAPSIHKFKLQKLLNHLLLNMRKKKKEREREEKSPVKQGL